MWTLDKSDSAPLVLARHVVLLCSLLAALNFAVYTTTNLHEAALVWAITVGVVAGTAVSLNGLWLLFFTKRARGRIVANSIRTAWVVAALVLVGSWQPYLHKRPPISEAKATERRAVGTMVNGQSALLIRPNLDGTVSVSIRSATDKEMENPQVLPDLEAAAQVVIDVFK